MLNLAVSDREYSSPSTLSRIGTAFSNVRSMILDQILPSARPELKDELSQYFTETRQRIGCIVGYRGPNVIVGPKNGQMGFEITYGDIMFVSGDGVWLGTKHFDEMPSEIDDYYFIRAGNRNDYMRMEDQRLDNALEQYDRSIEMLLAA